MSHECFTFEAVFGPEFILLIKAHLRSPLVFKQYTSCDIILPYETYNKSAC